MTTINISDIEPIYAETGFSCSMDGYSGLVSDGIDASIFLIPIIITLSKAVLPKDIYFAINHIY